MSPKCYAKEKDLWKVFSELFRCFLKTFLDNCTGGALAIEARVTQLLPCDRETFDKVPSVHAIHPFVCRA